MGIAGLLPLLKKASKQSHVRKLSGCTVAIDAYCWLHKGAFGCAEKLGKGEPTDAYITYCMKYIQVLLDNKVKPIVVLDGRNLPSKEHTEKKRREKRKENRELARKHLQAGRRKEAWECFTKCVDITPEMARQFIKVLRQKKIDYVVAPYEADAQLAYLATTGIADVVITEDSDLVLFGCPRIFFKMSVNGDGVLFDQSKLPQCMGLTPKTFQFERFRWMCILSGCDYLPSIPGIGLGRAKKIIMESSHEDIKDLLRSIPSILVKVDVEVTDEYISGFIQAENTFLYQLIYNTKERAVLPLNPYPEGMGPTDFPYAGRVEPDQVSLGLALGNIDLKSLQVVDHFEPLKAGYSATSIWSPRFDASVKGVFGKESKAPLEVGMQIPTPKKVSPKKRPLAVLNSDHEDSAIDDGELISLYSAKPATKTEKSRSSRRQSRSRDRHSSQSDEDDDNEDVKPEVKSVENSPSIMKRRRVSVEKQILGSPSSNTRSRNRIPFLKVSDKNQTIHVKSKYFKSEDNVKTEVALKQEHLDDSSTASEDEFVPPVEVNQVDLPTNLNIYSYESSSQESADLNHISASRGASPYVGLSNSEPTHSFSLKPCTVVIRKTDIPEITLDDDNDDAEENKSGDTGTTSQYFSNSMSPPKEFKRTVARTPALPVTKSACRRPGLSRSATKKTKQSDPKQPSIKEMFTRRSVQ